MRGGVAILSSESLVAKRRAGAGKGNDADNPKKSGEKPGHDSKSVRIGTTVSRPIGMIAEHFGVSKKLVYETLLKDRVKALFALLKEEVDAERRSDFDDAVQQLFGIQVQRPRWSDRDTDAE